MRADHLRLVEQRQLAGDLQHALDDEHDVGPARIVFVEDERRVGLQRVRQDALAELRHLQAVLDDDRVLADEIDAADVAVEVDADARPVEAGGDLLDVRRLAGAVVALDHHAAVVLEAGENGERHFPVEQIVRIQIGHVLVGLGKRRHLEVGVDPEHLAHRKLHVGKIDRLAFGTRLGLRTHYRGVLGCGAGSRNRRGGNAGFQTRPACFRKL